jgi:hypothetical protein
VALNREVAATNPTANLHGPSTAFSAEGHGRVATPSRHAGAQRGNDLLARSAGGTILSRAGTPDCAFDRVMRETSAYYLLGISGRRGRDKSRISSTSGQPARHHRPQPAARRRFGCVVEWPGAVFPVLLRGRGVTAS